MPKLKDITHHRYGRWLVKRYAGKTKSRSSLWLCLCDCGSQKMVVGRDLSRGRSKSCGCYRKERQALRINLVKKWHFVNKSKGFILRGKNLNQLVEDNREFFTEKELARYYDNQRACGATVMLRSLHYRRQNGRFPINWKGWTVG